MERHGDALHAQFSVTSSKPLDKTFCSSLRIGGSGPFYRIARYSILSLTILLSLLLGCRKKDPIPANREFVANLYIHASELPEVINCDQPFEHKKVKFTLRKPLDSEMVDNSTSWPPLCRTEKNRRDFPAVFLASTTALEIDISNYKGIKTIEIEAFWANSFNQKSSQIKFFGFKNELLETRDIPYAGDFTKLALENRFDNLKKIVVVGYAEVTAFRSLALKSN